MRNQVYCRFMKNPLRSSIRHAVSESGVHTANDHGPKAASAIPVVRKKRSAWWIPRINEHQVRQAEQAELARLQDLYRGTTPAGRDLYRKTLAGISSRLRRGLSTPETVRYAQDMFKAFPSLEGEFKQQFLIGRDRADSGWLTLDGMATLLVFSAKVRLKFVGEDVGTWC